MIGTEPHISNQMYLDVMAAISAADSVEDLIEIGRKYVTYKFGLYQHISAVGAQDYSIHPRYWTRGIRDEVLNYFESKGDQPEPVMTYILAHGRPFWLSDLQEKEEFSTGRIGDRVNLAMEFVGDSLMMPLFGPFNKRGYFFIGFEKPRKYFDDIFMWQMQAIVQAVHTRYCLIIESLRTHVKLTKREAEVLELITFGKTNPEIGLILGISTSTVAGHVKRIFLKFDASDRVTVALRARNLSP